jgi:ferritin
MIENSLSGMTTLFQIKIKKNRNKKNKLISFLNPNKSRIDVYWPVIFHPSINNMLITKLFIVLVLYCSIADANIHVSS